MGECECKGFVFWMRYEACGGLQFTYSLDSNVMHSKVFVSLTAHVALSEQWFSDNPSNSQVPLVRLTKCSLQCSLEVQ